MIITTKKEFESATKEYDAAQFFACQSCDNEEIKRANKKISELEKAFDNCPFDMDEDGNIELKIQID